MVTMIILIPLVKIESLNSSSKVAVCHSALFFGTVFLVSWVVQSSFEVLMVVVYLVLNFALSRSEKLWSI